MIDVRDAVKEYANGKTVVRALRGVSLRIGAGEFMSIAGPSGSGKTTLLNAVGCIDELTSGVVRIDGRDVTKTPPRELAALRREKIGFVFQSFNLIPVLTAYENVAFTLDLLGMKDSASREAVTAMLAEVGLDGLENRRPGELSGGQQQRVAIARALVTNPPMLLADEPTGNLDSRSGQDIIEIFHELHQQGHTIVLITHDDRVAIQAGRLIRILDGQIVEDREVG